MEVLRPTFEDTPQDGLALAPRLETLSGATVGIVSNGKKGTIPLFDALERELESRGVETVVRVTKSNYSAPADAEIMNGAQRWNALIAGVGD